jgi:ABC-2 type transport system ATP-binding protein
VTTSLAREIRALSPSPVATEAAIRLQGLTKRFPVRRGWNETLRHPLGGAYTTALQDITCEVRRGAFFGLLGPNGAGKTTLLKILATLILPDEGTACVEGFDVRRDPAGIRRTLAPVIADERSLHWRLSARENLRLFATLHGIRSDHVGRHLEETLSIVGLADAGAKPVGAFSSGMKQRLLVARALIAAPRVLLLDEPTRSLDPVSARDFRAFLKEELIGRRGCTVLLATHNTEEALGLCDCLGILDRGKFLAVGAPRQLKEQFADERYRLWTRHPNHPGFALLAERGAIRSRRVDGPAQDGWSEVEIDVPGGLAQIAQTLDFLMSRGAAIARCERAHLSLADLIERVLQRSGVRARA